MHEGRKKREAEGNTQLFEKTKASTVKNEPVGAWSQRRRRNGRVITSNYTSPARRTRDAHTQGHKRSERRMGTCCTFCALALSLSLSREIRIDKFFSFLYGPVVYRRKLKIFGGPVWEINGCIMQNTPAHAALRGGNVSSNGRPEKYKNWRTKKHNGATIWLMLQIHNCCSSERSLRAIMFCGGYLFVSWWILPIFPRTEVVIFTQKFFHSFLVQYVTTLIDLSSLRSGRYS